MFIRGGEDQSRPLPRYPLRRAEYSSTTKLRLRVQARAPELCADGLRLSKSGISHIGSHRLHALSASAVTPLPRAPGKSYRIVVEVKVISRLVVLQGQARPARCIEILRWPQIFRPAPGGWRLRSACSKSDEILARDLFFDERGRRARARSSPLHSISGGPEVRRWPMPDTMIVATPQISVVLIILLRPFSLQDRII